MKRSKFFTISIFTITIVTSSFCMQRKIIKDNATVRIKGQDIAREEHLKACVRSVTRKKSGAAIDKEVTRQMREYDKRQAMTPEGRKKYQGEQEGKIRERSAPQARH